MSPTFLLMTAVCAAPTATDVRTLAGISTGTLTKVAAGTVTFADGTVIPAGDWYSLRAAAKPLPPWPDQGYLEFGNGDRLAGTVVDADGNALNFKTRAGAQTLRFPLSALRVVWVRTPNDVEPEWLAGPRRRDVIQSRTGDLALGVIESIDAAKNQLRYQADGKTQQTEWARVAAVGFNTDLARVRNPKGPYYRLTFADGSRVSAVSLDYDGTAWTAESLSKGTLKLASEQLVAVDVEQGKAVFLADVKPSKYQYSSFDGEQYSRSADRNVHGRPLRLSFEGGESTYDRGLGLHAECAVAYPLGGKYRRFEALAGLDARDGRLGDAEIQIEVDGTVRGLPKAGHLNQAVGALPILLDVSGAMELKITVKRRSGGNVQDVVNLVEARLIP